MQRQKFVLLKRRDLKILEALMVLILTYASAYLKILGYEFSNFIGAFLLGFGIFQMNPPKIAFPQSVNGVRFNIAFVTRIGLSFTASVEYISFNWVFSLFQHLPSEPLIQVSSTIASVFIFILFFLFLGQLAFTRWEGVGMLSYNHKQRYQEVANMILLLSWFFACGGSNIMNFVVLPSFVLFILLREIFTEHIGKQMEEFIFRPGKRKAIFARIFKRIAVPKRSFLMTFIKSSRNPKTMWQAMIFIFSATFLSLNIRFYSLGNISESIALALWTIPILVAYYGIGNNWKGLKSVFVLLFFSFSVIFSILVPSSVPYIKRLLLISTSDFEGWVLGLFFLEIFFISIGAYPIIVGYFALRRGRSESSVGKAKLFWRIGECILVVPTSILIYFRGMMIGEGELFAIIAVSYAIFIIIISEIALYDEIQKFNRKIRNDHPKKILNRYLSSSTRRLTIEALILQILLPSLLLVYLIIHDSIGL